MSLRIIPPVGRRFTASLPAPPLLAAAGREGKDAAAAVATIRGTGATNGHHVLIGRNALNRG